MRKSYRRAFVFVAMAALFVLLTATSAFALTANTQQLTPGMTTRTIWDTSQVAVYELGNGTNYVNHNGYIHLEVSWKPTWADLDIYLLDEWGNTLSEEMGYMAVFSGKEVLDYQVRNISPDGRQIVTPEYGDPYMIGDKYYVVIVAFNDSAKYQIRGYYPQIDLSIGNSTTNQWNYYIESYRKPNKASSWANIAGPQWGGAYAMRPTSIGEGEAKLQWPADVDKKTITYDPAQPGPANMEQYIYAGADFDTVVENYAPQNWFPKDLGNGEFGLRNTFEVTPGWTAAPLKQMWYIPSLYLVASDPALGDAAPPRLGRSTMGFKATITFPENLRLISTPSKVKKGKQATVKGSFALNGEWQAGKSVQVQRQKGSTWVKVKNGTVNANGRWTVKFKVNATAKYRVVATGDPATGLDVEMTRTWKITATK